MYKFTWNGLSPWIIFKASLHQPIGFNSRVRYFCFWLEVWSRDFHRQNISTAVNKKKGQTMSNAHEIIEVKKDGEIVQTLPLQGSDEVQVTITVQEPEDVEKTPTLH
jgi:hypothetical protein